MCKRLRCEGPASPQWERQRQPPFLGPPLLFPHAPGPSLHYSLALVQAPRQALQLDTLPTLQGLIQTPPLLSCLPRSPF